jgi:hypothetical protein
VAMIGAEMENSGRAFETERDLNLIAT